MRHAHFLCGNKARAPNDQRLQLALPVHLALLLPLSLLLLLLLGMVAAVEAAGGGAEDAVMASIVAGDTADDGALMQPLALAAEVAPQMRSTAATVARDFMDRCLRMRGCDLNGHGPSRFRVRFLRPRQPREFVQAPGRSILNCSHEPGIALARHMVCNIPCGFADCRYPRPRVSSAQAPHGQ